MTEPLDSIAGFPMHGSRKMIEEGFRTRDGHLLEWFSKILGQRSTVNVYSRPEPSVTRLADSRRKHLSDIHANMLEQPSYSGRLPKLSNRQHWWVKSANSYRSLDSVSPESPAIIWNPFVAVSNIKNDVFNGRRVVIVDLLDDWTTHFAFAGIREETEHAYKVLFDSADHVTTNAEGTLSLAHRFGRTDAEMILNGVDSTRFTPTHSASGPLTVGYVGKIGNRVDYALVVETARALPGVKFVVAGPILDSAYKDLSRKAANITLTGDVHYDDMPSLLETFDIGWVPHNVGQGEVGGDVIKTYEYRAAGLPVLTTPVAGAGARGLQHVKVLDRSEHAAYLQDLASNYNRIQRIPESINVDMEWKSKAEHILSLFNR
ncbi:glycosyltransferase [Rhodococcus sp. MEB041]|uniref:glycosyltransferase n=1 Tax=Rhodococcus sp. MEB041 TaxID=3040323 RepID=UPI00254A8293|nr:glycosyltransferase [Rhodococcus sp. MEB041]